MKNTENYGDHGDHGESPAARLKAAANKTKLFSGTLACVSLFTFLFAFALLVPRCVAGHPSKPQQELFHAEHIVSEAAHELVRRGDCNDTAVTYVSDADAVTASAGTSVLTRLSVTPFLTVSAVSAMPPSANGVGVPDGVSFPISTQTALSTLYSISIPEVTTLTSTTTETTEVTVSATTSVSEPIDSDCQASTVFVTVTVVPTPSDSSSVTSSLGDDFTVTGNPGTVTDISTDVSYTSGLPDVTVSGNPSTYTNVETDVSVTTGPPDATVSGNPSTRTDIDTKYSVTSGLPDITVSGNPTTVTDIDASYSLSTSTGSATTKVISDIWNPLTSERKSTVTAVSTAKTTITTIDSSLVTITISDLYPPTSAAPETSADETSDADGVSATGASSTSTFTVTETGGPPAISTTVVEVPSSAPYPNGTTVTNYPSGTISTVPGPTTPPIISGGTKKPEPRGLSMGTTNLGCTVMLIAVIMFVL